MAKQHRRLENSPVMVTAKIGLTSPVAADNRFLHEGRAAVLDRWAVG
jgi:hypothetical protein